LLLFSHFSQVSKKKVCDFFPPQQAAVVDSISRNGFHLASVRAVEEEEMTLFAESKESLSIAHCSSTALTELSVFPGEDCVPGFSVHHASSLLAIVSTHFWPF
jgi:hypothetical protein